MSKQGGVTPMDSIVTTATAVGQRPTVKAIQKGTVYGQSVLRSTENRRKRANLGGVMREVKGRKSAQSTIKQLKRDGQGLDLRSQL